jgi:Ca-activated chloride channel family protein
MDALKGFAAAAILFAVMGQAGAQEPEQQETFRFRSGVELINVTATVSDGRGRFVSGLGQDDFRVYEDGEPRPITHFTSERVPVSLGIVLDTSGSMEGEKMLAARQALQRFLFDLLGPEDEIFLYRFDNRPHRVQDWTTDRERVAAELRRIQPRGATTLYDAIAEAVPLAASGRHRKKALLIISDGNDTSSYTEIDELKKLIRESEVLVYAIGIDAMVSSERTRRPWFSGILEQRRPTPFPFPIPGRRPQPPPRGPVYPPRFPPTGPSQPNMRGSRGDEPVNVAVLREIAETSGGRAEIIWQPRDLDPATAGIADELSKQYFLGYPASGVKDGRWHAIRVEVVDRPNYIVRARRGYVATP